MKQHKWHKEIKAWADGAEIEYRFADRTNRNDEWELVESLNDFGEEYKYRIKPQPKEPQCNPHPKAPHGFNRNASHNSNNYVCDCEGWDAWQDGYEEGLRKGLELEQPKEPQYLYVYRTPIREDGCADFEAKLSRVKIGLDNYIGKIKLEETD